MRIKKSRSVGITVLFVLLLLPFFSIARIQDSMSESIYQVWQTVSCICLLGLTGMSLKKRLFNWTVYLFALYQAIVLLSSIYHQGLNFGILTVTVAALMIFVLLQTTYYQDLVRALCVIVAVCALINFPGMLRNFGADDAEFFIGGKNALGIFLVPGAFLLIIHAYNSKGMVPMRTRLLVGFCLLCVLISGSSTGVVVSIAGIALMLIAEKKPPRKSVWLLAIIIFYVLLLLFFEDFSKTSFWIEFTRRFGKDSTLTSRAQIWNEAKALIEGNWLFGAGRGSIIIFEPQWGYAQATLEAHNLLLEILMIGGVAALAVYAILFLNTVKRLDMTSPRERIIFAALCVLLINGLTEATANNFFLTIMLGVACRYAAEKRLKKDRYGQTQST